MVIAAMKLKDTPWKESYDNLDSILKSRDITLPTKVCVVKAMVFPVVMYGYFEDEGVLNSLTNSFAAVEFRDMYSSPDP